MNNSDPNEVSQWLSRTRPDLLRYCHTLTRDRAEAEDLVQEAMIRVLDRLQAVSRLNLNKPYVFRIARNLWIDACRKRQKHVNVPYDESIPEAAAPVEDDALVTRELLEQLMHRLLPKPFVIVLLSDVFGLTAKETAACIHMTEGTVQVALSRARKRLRLLAARGEPEGGVIRSGSAASKDAASFRELLETVVEAFRRQDPHHIYRAYLRLYESGSRLAEIRSEEGRLCFTFRDPDGNLILVTG